MTYPISFELFALIIFASLLSLIGGAAFLYTKRLSVLLDKYGVPFAAGTMIVTALVGLLPEAFHAIGVVSFIVFTFSFLIIYGLEKLLLQFHHHSHDGEHHSKKHLKGSVPIVLVGDTIHNFIDGVAIAVAYAINPGLAVITALSTFLHEVPHEIGDFSILLKAGFSKKKVLIINILSASVSILGALLVSYFIPSEEVIGYLLAVTAGIFFYLGIVDFLPHAFESEHNSSRSSKFMVVAAVLAGAIIMTISLNAVPHGHEYESAGEHLEEGDNHEEEGEIHEDEVQDE